MYPKYFQGLSGWKVREISFGEKSLFCVAETSTISWGQSMKFDLTTRLQSWGIGLGSDQVGYKCRQGSNT